MGQSQQFDSEPAYNEKYIKTKIKSYEGKTTNWNFMIVKGSQGPLSTKNLFTIIKSN